MDKPTLADVARVAGVHPGTASRALNPALAGRISPATTARVHEAAKALGYMPDTRAQSLRTRRTRTIGVVIPDLANPVFAPIVRGIEDGLRDAGYQSLLASTDNDADRETAALRVLQTRYCDGYIVASATRDDATVRELCAQRTALVLLNRLVDDLDVPAVVSDDSVGIRAAVDYLAAGGHRSIAHIAGPQTLSVSAARVRAFCDAVASSKVRPRMKPVVQQASDFTVEAGRVAMAGLLEHEQVTAVLAANDLIAIGCYQALAAAGLRCPEDVSVIGFNDMPLTAHLNPPLATVAMPQHEMGWAAAQLVLDYIERPNTPPRTEAVPTAFIPRDSARPLPAAPESERPRRSGRSSGRG
ncbi:LacI family DNA-binding transcriptional regulator [Mycolicibacterium sp.]|uniref:LacI family DNA-binding transcriptional regulator n=1 Tax=Mycolicibacterium sp. TaxID=2320850 RepID=UPI003D0EBCC5